MDPDRPFSPAPSLPSGAPASCSRPKWPAFFLRGFILEQRRHVLLLLIALAIITFLDRISIAVAGPRIQAELHITPARWGWVFGAFVLAYGLFEIPTEALGHTMGHPTALTPLFLWLP